jgi:hypothetical protein
MMIPDLILWFCISKDAGVSSPESRPRRVREKSLMRSPHFSGQCEVKKSGLFKDTKLMGNRCLFLILAGYIPTLAPLIIAPKVGAHRRKHSKL